jgi:oxygen-dependent protoporphyrinogen oxidase
MPKIVIIGGGISGLATAFRILERLPNAHLTVLESSSKPGGQVGTTDRDGFRVERGPNGLFDAKPNGIDLCKAVGLGNELIAGSESSRKNRFLFVNDKIQAMPRSPLGILTTPTLSIRGRLSLLREPFRKRRDDPSDESIAAFARRRFGEEAAATFIDGLVTGIYAGDPERLSVRSCFPRLVKFEAEAGGVLRGMLRSRKHKRAEAKAKGETPPGPQRLWSFPGGLRTMIDALANRLRDAVQCGVMVKRLEKRECGWLIHGDGESTWPADAVVLACPAYEQARLLAEHDATLAEALSSIAYNRIAVVALGYRREQVTGPQDGFGYIAPQRLGRDVLGVQWCSSIYPDRAPPGCVLWRALCGGIKRGDVADLPDSDLLRIVHREVSITTDVTGEPVFSEIVRWPRAIPQYELGHAERVARIESSFARLPGLFPGGNSLYGVSLADCAERGERLAGMLSQFLSCSKSSN